MPHAILIWGMVCLHIHSTREETVGTTQLSLTKQHTWELQRATSQLQKGADTQISRTGTSHNSNVISYWRIQFIALRKLMESLLSLGSPQKSISSPIRLKDSHLGNRRARSLPSIAAVHYARKRTGKACESHSYHRMLRCISCNKDYQLHF